MESRRSTGRDGGFTPCEDSTELHGRNHGDGRDIHPVKLEVVYCIYLLLDLADPGRSWSQTIHIEHIEVIYENL